MEPRLPPSVAPGPPDLTLKPPSWHTDAACRYEPPDLWFPERGDDWRPAVRICQTCPVADACLAWAVENNIRDGTWGGLTAGQRRDLDASAA